MKTLEERLRSYEPLWENWTYTGEFLGEGAMSSVFEIHSTAMGEEVAALKIITVKKNPFGKVEIPENALNEIKILRDLSGCPNIVNYHDSTQRQIFDEDNNLSEIDILIKMEKLKSLSEGDKLSEEQVIKLAKDMCNALIHASKHNIIHRDIKPQNIFVDKEGIYKLGDFGIAKIVSDMSRHYTMNIGTMAYTAPEVYNNATGVYNVSSDIYSLGIVLYVYLNNGCLPFFDGTLSHHEAISKRLSGAQFPSPTNGSNNLKKIVMRACHNDVTKRYQKPQEMLEDLELMSTGGKKLVVDPFATLDANIDVSDDAPPVTTSASPAASSESTPASTSGGLKIKMNSTTSGSTSASTSGGMKPTMKSTTSETPKATPSAKPASTSGGLKTTMKSTISKKSEETPRATDAKLPKPAPTPETPKATPRATGAKLPKSAPTPESIAKTSVAPSTPKAAKVEAIPPKAPATPHVSPASTGTTSRLKMNIGTRVPVKEEKASDSMPIAEKKSTPPSETTAEKTKDKGFFSKPDLL